MRRASVSISILSVVLGLSFFIPEIASAVSVYGKVAFVGTTQEYKDTSGGYNAQFRIKILNSTCTGDDKPKERWIGIKSGRMDGQYAHNSANFKNALSIALAAFLSGKNVQIDGVPSCKTDKSQIINLYNSTIGIY